MNEEALLKALRKLLDAQTVRIECVENRRIDDAAEISALREAVDAVPSQRQLDIEAVSNSFNALLTENRAIIADTSAVIQELTRDLAEMRQGQLTAEARAVEDAKERLVQGEQLRGIEAAIEALPTAESVEARVLSVIEQRHAEARAAIDLEMAEARAQIAAATDAALLRLSNDILVRATPGRDGKDGHDGRDGKDGHDGASGTDGLSGKDGEQGERGIQGEIGPSLIVAGAETRTLSDPRDHEIVFTMSDGSTSAVMISTPGMVLKGVFDDTAEYRQGDMTHLNGHFWIAKRDQPGPVTNGDGWVMLASQGKRGAKGDIGDAPYSLAEIVSVVKEVVDERVK